MRDYYILHIPSGQSIMTSCGTLKYAEFVLEEADFYFSKKGELQYTWYKQHFRNQALDREYIPKEDNKMVLTIFDAPERVQLI